MGDKAKAIKIEQQDEVDDAEKQPPMKVTKNFKGGQKRDYNFLKSVNSLEELDKIRFENSCHAGARKQWPTFESHTMICNRNKQGKGKLCDFELLAVRQAQENSTIDVYAHSKHNHSIMSEDKRASVTPGKELMPAENPPTVFHTPGNIEWKFLQTLTDYVKMNKFGSKSGCTIRTDRESHRRLRLPCSRLRSNYKCPFQLLALKTTKKGYHVYKFGEHNNHPVINIKPKKKQQPAARGHQQKQQGMEVDKEEEDDQEEKEESKDEGGEGQDQLTDEGEKKQPAPAARGRQQKQQGMEVDKEEEDDDDDQEEEEESNDEEGEGQDQLTDEGEKKQQPAARGRQQKQQKMAVAEEEEEENDENGQEENEMEEGEIQDDEVEGQDLPIEEGGEEDNDYDIIMIYDDGGIKVQPKQEVKQEGKGSMEETTETPLGNEAAQDDDIIVIDDDDDGIKVEQQQQEEMPKGSKEKVTEIPLKNEPNPTEETLEETLQKAEVKGYYEWMERFEPNQIEPKVMGMDTASRLKMVEMADQEVRKHPAKFDKWRPWLKHVMPKCMSEVKDFCSKYKDLTGLMFRHVKD